MKRFIGSRRAGDLLLWLAICAPVALSAWQPAEDTPGGLPWTWVRAAAFPLLGAAIFVGRRYPVAAALVPTVLALAATPELLTTDFVLAQIVLAFLLGRRTPDLRTGLLFCGGVCLTALVLLEFVPGKTQWSWFMVTSTTLLTIVAPWLAGRYARQHNELARTGWELAGQLEREQDLIGEQARLLERSRIAGDMHDSLGHELSLIALRAAALQVRPGLDEDAQKAAAELRESTAHATERLREIIGVLREDGSGAAPIVPPGDTVAALVERATESGVEVRLDGDLGTLPPMIDRAAYRVVQEALTNAAKHAPGAAVTVLLRRDAGEAVVTVTCAAPPAGPLPGVVTGGYGLIGLDERVRLAGGRLHADEVNGGFEVTARLPVKPGAAATPPTSTGRHALARRRVRRSMIDVVWVPVVAGTALVSLAVGYEFYSSSHSVLDAEVYANLRIGENRTSVEPRLPPFQAAGEKPMGAPVDPPGVDECRIYRIRARSLSPAYRVCFTADRLSHRDQVTITQPDD